MADHPLRVGRPYVPGKTKWPDRVEYNFRSAHHELRVFLSGLEDWEVQGIARGPCEFGLFVHKDVIYFLYRFPEARIPWSDCPYSWWLVPEDERIPPGGSNLADEPHALLTVILVEARTGIVRGLRQVTFSPAFTAALALAIREQASKPFPSDYDDQIAELNRLYSSSNLMLKDARSHTIGGT